MLLVVGIVNKAKDIGTGNARQRQRPEIRRGNAAPRVDARGVDRMALQIENHGSQHTHVHIGRGRQRLRRQEGCQQPRRRDVIRSGQDLAVGRNLERLAANRCSRSWLARSSRVFAHASSSRRCRGIGFDTNRSVADP